MNYSQIYPQIVAFHILSVGEYRLMNSELFTKIELPIYKILEALQILFATHFSTVKIASVFKVNMEILIKNGPGSITSKRLFETFINNSLDLFSLTTVNTVQRDSSVTYLLFETIYQLANQVGIYSPGLKSFNFDLINYFKGIFINFNQEIKLKIILNFIYWDDLDGLSLAVYSAIEMIFYIHNGSSLIHFATMWSSLSTLNLLLDLINENALNETFGNVSPFIFAIKLQNEKVLNVFSNHGFNGETIVIFEAIQLSAKDYSEHYGHKKSFNYFKNLK